MRISCQRTAQVDNGNLRPSLFTYEEFSQNCIEGSVKGIGGKTKEARTGCRDRGYIQYGQVRTDDGLTYSSDS
jgi:hypothetical protein